MIKRFLKSSLGISVLAGLIVAFICWIASYIYASINSVKLWQAFVWLMNYQINVGCVIFICILFIIYFSIILHKAQNEIQKKYYTKQEINQKLNNKVECYACHGSWNALFAMITPYHPLHEWYTDSSYYINYFKSMISNGLSHKPSPDYYEIEYGIEGLYNVLKESQYISDTDCDSISFYLKQCSDKEVGAKKERLLKLIQQMHRYGTEQDK